MRRISSTASFNRFLAENNDRYTVIDFSASWCAPCRRVAPILDRLSKEHKHIRFINLLHDDFQDDAEDNPFISYGIRVFPTFIVIKNFTIIKEILGANVNELIHILNTL